MKNDFIWDEIAKYNADGVDFVPLWGDYPSLPPIICSYTKEQWEQECYIPKSDRLYWKIDNCGNKIYVDGRI